MQHFSLAPGEVTALARWADGNPGQAPVLLDRLDDGRLKVGQGHSRVVIDARGTTTRTDWLVREDRAR